MNAEEETAHLKAQLNQVVETLATTQEQLRVALARIEELEGKKRPPAFVKANVVKPKEKKARKKRQPQQNGVRRREEPSQIIEHHLDMCPTCSLRLGGINLARRRQVIELPSPVPVEIIEHRIYKGRCANCRKWHEAACPMQGLVIGQGRIGVRIASVIGYLRCVLRVPIRQIRQYLQSVHALSLSSGEVVEVLHALSQATQMTVEFPVFLPTTIWPSAVSVLWSLLARSVVAVAVPKGHRHACHWQAYSAPGWLKDSTLFKSALLYSLKHVLYHNPEQYQTEYTLAQRDNLCYIVSKICLIVSQEKSMDVLTDVLNALELKGCITASRALVPPWRYHFTVSQDMIFHLLGSDGGYLSLDGETTPPMHIEGGGVLLFPFGHAHSICDELTSPLTWVSHVAYSEHEEFRAFPDTNEGSKMVALCGAFRLEHPGAFPLLHSLPHVIHIPTKQGDRAPGFSEIVRLIAREAAAPRLGTDVMLRRLTELLFIHIIRVWVEQQAENSTGWLAALHDQSISTALGLIHQSPERGWKVEELAEEVALSRSVFSLRFTRLVGEPPITYLTHWRMHKATRLLKNNVEVDKIAELLGYESEVAFRKAFKREVGMSPARYRKLGESVSTT